MIRSIFIIGLLTICSSGLPQEQASIDIGIVTTQREMIEMLSGHTPLQNGERINSRSKREEKKRARKYLQQLITAIGLEPLSQRYVMPNVNPFADLLLNPFKGENIYTILPATNNNDEYIILGAHYDSELHCPGAIDNGSGMALIYGVLQALAKLDVRNKNVILIYFDQEEEELVGSKAFAKFVKKRDFKIHSVHTFDAIGWDADGDRAIELELPTPYLEELYRRNAQELDIPIHITTCNSTDHHSFRTLGYPAIGLTDEYYNGDYTPYKDTPDDKFGTVNFAYIESCTKLVTETITEILSL